MSGAVQRMRATLRAAGVSVTACAAVQQSYALALREGSAFSWRRFYFDVYAAMFPLQFSAPAGARARSARIALRQLLDDDFGSQLFAREQTPAR